MVVGNIYESEGVLVNFGPENAQEYEYFVDNCYGVDIDAPYRKENKGLYPERSLKNRFLSFHEAYYICSMQEKKLQIKLNDVEITYEDGASLKELWFAFSSIRKNFKEFMVVYHHFRSEGLRIKSGFNYGGHFVLYDGSPEEFHSKYLVYIILSEENQDTEVSWHTIQTLTRIAEDVKKTVLLCQVTKDASDKVEAHEQEKKAVEHSSDGIYTFHDEVFKLDILPIRFWDIKQLENKSKVFEFQPQKQIPKKQKFKKQKHHNDVNVRSNTEPTE